MNLDIVKKASDELLELLPLKSRNILIARFGLNGDKPKTLEAIGKTLGITRERVRQIEAISFNKLKESRKSQSTQKILEILSEIMIKQGGFLGIKGFEKNIFKRDMTLLQENQLKIILNSNQKLYYRKDNGNFDGIWYFKSSEKNLKKINGVYECLLNYFETNKSLMKLSSLVEIVSASDFCTAARENSLFNDEYAKNRLETILSIGKLTGLNLLNEWGLKSWKLIKPSGARERAYLIFKKYQRPLHFREVTELINKDFDLKKPAIPETVCNAVIHFDEFVAVEYGIYALVEWKLFDEEIKNEIVNFLEKTARESSNKQGAFVKIDGIAKHIEEKLNKNIKMFVIQANLFDKEIFSRRGDAYMLKIDKE